MAKLIELFGRLDALQFLIVAASIGIILWLVSVMEDSTNISNKFLVLIALQQPACSIEKLPWIVARTVERS